MTPTLWPGDGLDVVPYGDSIIRRGDVVVFPHPYLARDVAHRVIAVAAQGVRTRGDNNSKVDTFLTPRAAIIGRVVAVKRGSKRRTVRGGTPGMAVHRLRLMRRVLRFYAFKYLRPLYRRLADTGIFYGWHKPFVKTTFVSFRREGGTEMQLVAGRRPIARRAPGTNSWVIRFPFRLFIDRRKLPQ